MRCRGDLERCGDTPDPIAAGRRSHRVAARLSRLSLDLRFFASGTMIKADRDANGVP